MLTRSNLGIFWYSVLMVSSSSQVVILFFGPNSISSRSAKSRMAIITASTVMPNSE